MEIEQVDLDGTDAFSGERQRNVLGAAAALLGNAIPGVVDQDAPHHDGGQTDELRPVTPVNLTLIEQTHVGLVNERRGLKGVPGALPSQVAGREPAKLPVDQRQHRLGDLVLHLR